VEHIYNPSTLRRLRQKDHEFEASLGYKVRPGFRKKTKEKQGLFNNALDDLVKTINIIKSCS
jgi:hypothetical protein